MSESVISLSHLKKCYGKHEVLSDVNMQVNKGDIYGLIGRNGAGKTTLFKVLLGQCAYQGGEISLFGGKDAKGLSKGRQRIGFSIGANFFPRLSPQKNLAYYCRLKGIKNPRKEIQRVLQIVGLEGVKKPVKNFSLGMKQRLGIANAILGNPEILILDEPANGLDPQGIVDVRNLIIRLNEEFGMTILVSSHILAELQNTAHRFGIVNNGQVVKEITTEDLENFRPAVRISVDDLEKAQKALADAGVNVLETQTDSATLEDYYFNLVGGKKND